MTYIDLMRMVLPKSEFIEYIKLKGNMIRHLVVNVSDNYYSEPILMQYGEKYFISFSLLHKYQEECPFEYIDEVAFEKNAIKRFEKMIKNIRKQ